MKRRIILLSLLIAALVFTCSCSGSGDAEAPGPAGDGWMGGVLEDKNESSGADKIVFEDRKIIKTVNESVQTESYDAFLDTVREKVSALGGYVTSANYRGDSYYGKNDLRQATLTLRIPAERLAV